MRFVALCVTAILFSSCSSTSERGVYRSDNALCEQMATFAMSVSPGQQKSVKFVRGGLMYVDHHKSCAHSDDDPASIVFCQWLLANTSAEVMEANINEAMACLQGQKIVGTVGNTGLSAWRGEVSFWRTQLEEGVEAKLAYSIPPLERRAEERFLEITFERES